VADWKERLENAAEAVLFDEPMKNHTSFKIGGPADALVCAQSEDEIQSVLELCRMESVPCMVMGNGSNMLVSDKGIEGVVIKIGESMSAVSAEGVQVTAQAGVLLSKLANTVCKKGLSGLEFAAGIPGALGGALYMNAGAYGGEMKDVVRSVRYINEKGNICTAEGGELDFGYRHSMFSERGCVILSCIMELSEDNEEDIRARAAEFNRRRAEKQPLSMPSAGSTFKRPEGYFAGKLIEDAGLKGYAVGGAQVSEKHSGFVVNTGGATAQDVLDLIEYIQKTVYDKFNVSLETEVRLIGRQGR
jgi:UDP-N-acetylmuramate dehydrogenase